ncbi:MAG: ATP synthase F0 subunit B [Treponema sp.]|nr:ATP synthase F0 subunit B [Treponema sp.]
MLDFSVTFVITIINIIILYLILKAILFKPTTNFMADRVRRIQNSIDQAEKDKVTAQKLLEQYKKQLNNAEMEADAIIRFAKEQAELEREQILDNTKVEAGRILDAAQSKLEADRLAAMALFKAEAAALVLSAASRLVRRELSGAEQQRYAAEVLDNLVQDTINREKR